MLTKTWKATKNFNFDELERLHQDSILYYGQNPIIEMQLSQNLLSKIKSELNGEGRHARKFKSLIDLIVDVRGLGDSDEYYFKRYLDCRELPPLSLIDVDNKVTFVYREPDDGRTIDINEDYNFPLGFTAQNIIACIAHFAIKHDCRPTEVIFTCAKTRDSIEINLIDWNKIKVITDQTGTYRRMICKKYN